MRLIHSPSTYPLGLDISERAVKLAQLKRTRHLPSTHALAVAELPAGLVVEGIITDVKKLAAIVRDTLHHPLFGNFGSREVIVSLPEQKTFTKLLTLSLSTAEAQRREEIARALEKELPYAIEDVHYDWHLLKRHGTLQHLVAAAVPRDVAQGYRDVCLSAKLTPLALEPEALATARCVVPLNKMDGKTSLILDIGAAHASCMAWRDGALLFTAGIPFSGDAISNNIAKELGISQKRAETAKIIGGLSGSYLEEVLTELLKRRLREVIRYLATHYPDATNIDKLYICGGGAAITGLAEHAAAILSLPTQCADVFINLTPPTATLRERLIRAYRTDEPIAGRTDARQSIVGRFTTAIGLALRGIYHAEL